MTEQNAAQVNPTRPNMAKGYGISTSQDGLMTWEWVDEQMTKARNYWIGTTRPDGRPHVVPVWGAWIDGALYFGGDPAARRSRNLAANPHLSVHLESGDEVVIIEGKAEQVTDPALIRRFLEMNAAKYNMPVDQLAAPDMHVLVYRVKPSLALAWLERDYPNTATRWVFEG